MTELNSDIDSPESIPCDKSIQLWNWFLETSSSCEGIEDFRIVVVIWCVKEDIPFGQPICNTQTILQLSAGDEKSISELKIYILWDMANSIPYSVPTQFQESIARIFKRLWSPGIDFKERIPPAYVA
jgi:hypothetical protein